MVDTYPLVSTFLLNAMGLGVVLCSFVLLVCLLSVRPENRHKGFSLLIFAQGLFELTLGVLIVLARPTLVHDTRSFCISTIVVICIYSVLFIRLYFINVLRAMFSK